MITLTNVQPERCPEQITAEAVAQFNEQGFLAYTDLLSEAEVERARTRLDELVRETAQAPGAALRNGSIVPPGGRFGVQFEPGCKPETLSDAQLELKVRKLMWYCEVDPFFGWLKQSHPRLRALLDGLLGPGAIMFQDMALIKPPLIGSEKPWHQDNAYFAVTPLDQVVGFWIALDHAAVANGCMHVIPGGHKLGPLKHFHGRDCEIEADRLVGHPVLPVPLPPGGVLIFKGMLPHQTPPNRSPQRRRALQLHYRGAQTLITPRDEYDRIYAEADGTPASCNANP